MISVKIRSLDSNAEFNTRVLCAVKVGKLFAISETKELPNRKYNSPGPQIKEQASTIMIKIVHASTRNNNPSGT